MKQLQHHGKDAAVVKNSMLALASSPQDNIDDLARKHIDDVKPCIQDTRDVTQEFLVPREYQGPARLECDYVVYRGLVQSLTGYSMNAQNTFRSGVMGGRDGLVIEVVLSPDVTQILDSPERVSRWDSMGYMPMGLMVWDKDQSPSKHVDALKKMQHMTPKRLLLLVFGAGAEPLAWHFDGNEFISVSLGNKAKNRRKGVQYRVVPLHQVGVSMQDEAEFLVSDAISKHISKKLETTASSQPLEKLSCFKKVCVPSDGYCFWHAILGGLQLKKYMSISRNDAGFAVNRRQEQSESQAAKGLLKAAVEKGADENCFENGFVEITDVAMVGVLLNLSIRISVTDEARDDRLSCTYARILSACSCLLY